MAPTPSAESKDDISYKDVLHRLDLVYQHANFTDAFVENHTGAREARNVAKFAIQVLNAAQAEGYYHKETVLRGVAKMASGMSRDAAMAQAREERIQKNKAINEATFTTKSEAETIDISSKNGRAGGKRYGGQGKAGVSGKQDSICSSKQPEATDKTA